jgi:hypothetical protein
MALLWLDSFDHYVSADLAEKYATTAGVLTISATTGRRGSGGVLVGSSGTLVTPTLASASTTAIVGVALKLSNLSLTPRIDVRSGATVQASVKFDASGFAVAQRGTATVLGTATTGALSASVYAFIEIKVVVHPSTGSFIVRVNEAEVLNLTGVNTAASGSAAWDVVALIGSTGNPLYDDFYVLDGSGAAPLNNLIGDCRVDARYPNNNGAHLQWTPTGDVNRWQCVDETAPDDDTTYNSTATVNDTDTHAVQDAPVVGGTLYGVQLCLSMKKTAPGTCSIAPVVRSASTTYAGTATNPTTSYAYACTPYGTDPGTGAAWTEAGFNAAEFGYRRTA